MDRFNVIAPSEDGLDRARTLVLDPLELRMMTSHQDYYLGFFLL